MRDINEKDKLERSKRGMFKHLDFPTSLVELSSRQQDSPALPSCRYEWDTDQELGARQQQPTYTGKKAHKERNLLKKKKRKKKKAQEGIF